jgi:predicted ATPase
MERLDPLLERLETVHISGTDYREDAWNAEEGATATVPRGDWLDFFSVASGGAPPAAEEVKLQWGRKMSVAAAGGVCHISFADLCVKPLGAEDFVAIADVYHTVVLSGVRSLKKSEHNEARRFTNFIDAAYEANANLVLVSAEDTSLDALLAEVVELQNEKCEGGHQATLLGVFEKMYDDTPNFQLQIKEQGRAKYDERLKAMTAGAEDTNDGKGGVSVAAVGSLQESGFAALRAISRLKEMQTSRYQSSGGIHRPARRVGNAAPAESTATA